MLAIGLAVGCSSGRQPPPDSPAPGAAKLTFGDACSVDAECAAGHCHPERRICVCDDASCPPLLQCDPYSGRCVTEPAGCSDDHDCDRGSWCDHAARTCRPIRSFCEPCVRDQDCGPGNRCLDPGGGAVPFCGEACTTSADCSRPGTRCDAGQCWPNENCAAVAPCTPDSGAACTRDEDCPTGQSCESRVCRANDSGCAAGERCDRVTLDCYASCRSARDCGSNERCVGDRCEPLPPCDSDADCPLPRVCRVDPLTQQGTCVAGCSDDTGCPLGTRCVATDEGRTVCAAGCDDDADCLLDQVCEAGTCRSGRCQTTDACGSCQVCGPGGRCIDANDAPYCAACGIDRDCGAGGLCNDGRCAPACPATGCPRGFACTPAGAKRVCFPTDDFCDTECS